MRFTTCHSAFYISICVFSRMFFIQSFAHLLLTCRAPAGATVIPYSTCSQNNVTQQKIMKNYVTQLQRVGLGCYSTASINRFKTNQQLCLKLRIATTTLHMNMILINSNQKHPDVNKSSTGIDLLWAGSCLTCTVYRALHNCTLSPTLAGR